MARSSPLLALAARILPAEFRERVFIPAVEDHRGDIASRRPGFGRQVARELVIVAECLRLGLPQLLWHRGRLTRAGRVVALTLIIGGGLTWLAAARIGYVREHPWP